MKSVYKAFFIRCRYVKDNRIKANNNESSIGGLILSLETNLVNSKPEVFPQQNSILGIAESMFERFNRGAGSELEFDGSSMSVGDLVVIIGDDKISILLCDNIGFVPISDPQSYTEIVTFLLCEQMKVI